MHRKFQKILGLCEQREFHRPVQHTVQHNITYNVGSASI